MQQLDKSLLALKDLLFLGFDAGFELHLLQLPPETEYTWINDPRAAHDWLEQRVERIETFQPPYAIVACLTWLQADNFNLSRKIAAHPDLKNIPIIALADKGQDLDATSLFDNGIDDCYFHPVEWSRLQTRIEFLNQYKPVLLEKKALLKQEPFTVRTPFLKRAFDIIGASLIILLTAPVWLLVALAIKLESKGPILYHSRRVGAGYRVFNFLKFRSMSVHADRLLDEYRFMNQYADGTVFVKIADDPRITKVGRFIRKYSIDELPQLLNVLKGDMSLVGNRPLPIYEAELLTREDWCARFMAPAGITGLWQVTKRGASNMSQEERIALDVRYAQTFNLLTDLNIIMRTPMALVQKENV